MASCAGATPLFRCYPALDDGDLMLVAGGRQPGVALPSVGVNHGTGHHGTLDEGTQAVPGHIHDAPQADATDAAAALLGRDQNDGLGLDFPPSRALLRAAYVSLVDLDLTEEAIAARAPGAAYAARSRPSRSCPAQAPAASPRH